MQLLRLHAEQTGGTHAANPVEKPHTVAVRKLCGW